MKMIAIELSLKANRYLNRLLGRGFAGSKSIPVEVAAAARFLPREKAVVVDGGANTGEWTRALLKIAGDQVEHIYAFEPIREHHSKISPLPGAKVEIISEALSDSVGELHLYAHVSGASTMSAYKRDLSHLALETTHQSSVSCTTIDRFMEQKQIKKIDFLKLDVEGHELQALKGASRALQIGSVRALSFEFGGCNIDSRTYFKDFWQLLSEDYQLFIVNPLTTIKQIDTYDEWWECFLTTNFIAVHKELVR